MVIPVSGPMHFRSAFLLFVLVLSNEPVPCLLAGNVNEAGEALDDRAASTNLYARFGGDVRRLLAYLKREQKSVVVGHRGGVLPDYAENSLTAFNHVLEGGVGIIEFDVVSSKDRVDFLHHDFTLERTTTGWGRADEIPWGGIAELRLKDGSGRVTRDHSLRVEDALQALSGRSFLMIDLKAPSDTGDLVRQVDHSGLLSASIFIAYNFHQAREVRRAAPEAVIALGVRNLAAWDNIVQEGLSGQPLVALTGAFKSDLELYHRLNEEGHFVLAGSYLGDNSPESQLRQNLSSEALNRAGESGIQLIVSNSPLAVHDYLRRHGLTPPSDSP